MNVQKMADMVGGWFVGNFTPHAHLTQDFEVCYKSHKKGDKEAAHYHKEAIEISYLVKGKFRTRGITLEAGDIFTLQPYEVTTPEFLEDCEIVVVKIPSVPGDKFTCEV